MVGGELRRFEFDREIVWLQESESVLRFVHGGEELKRGSTHTDFYGYLSSAEGMVDEAERAAKSYSVTEASSLVVEIVSRVYQRPVIEADEARAYNVTTPRGHKSRWAYVPDDWRKQTTVAGETLHPSLGRIDLGEQVVWSSKLSRGENAARMEAFRARWPAITQVDRALEAAI